MAYPMRSLLANYLGMRGSLTNWYEGQNVQGGNVREEPFSFRYYTYTVLLIRMWPKVVINKLKKSIIYWKITTCVFFLQIFNVFYRFNLLFVKIVNRSFERFSVLEREKKNSFICSWVYRYLRIRIPIVPTRIWPDTRNDSEIIGRISEYQEDGYPAKYATWTSY